MRRRLQMSLAAMFCSTMASALGLAPAGAADQQPILVGEVGALVQEGGAPLQRALRAVLEREVAQIPLDRAATKGRAFVISGSVTKLEKRADASASSEACTVSVVVREKKSGAIRAILEGRARGQGDVAVEQLVEAAAHVALVGVPEAIR